MSRLDYSTLEKRQYYSRYLLWPRLTLSKILPFIRFLCGIDHESHEACYWVFLLLIHVLPEDVFILPCHFSIVKAPQTMSIRIWRCWWQQSNLRTWRVPPWSNLGNDYSRTAGMLLCGASIWTFSFVLLLATKWPKYCKCFALNQAQWVAGELPPVHKHQQRGNSLIWM